MRILCLVQGKESIEAFERLREAEVIDGGPISEAPSNERLKTYANAGPYAI